MGMNDAGRSLFDGMLQTVPLESTQVDDAPREPAIGPPGTTTLGHIHYFQIGTLGADGLPPIQGHPTAQRHGSYPVPTPQQFSNERNQ
jgi:hypothetical protein